MNRVYVNWFRPIRSHVNVDIWPSLFDAQPLRIVRLMTYCVVVSTDFEEHGDEIIELQQIASSICLSS